MLYWEDSLEADPSKRGVAHNYLQIRDRYRQSKKGNSGQTPRKVNGQEYPP
jgi:hypothetical protein